jgi:hypothetical protein
MKCDYCKQELKSDGIAQYCDNPGCVVFNKYVMYLDRDEKA